MGDWSLSGLQLHVDKLPNGKKKREPSFEVNVVVNIEGLHNRINNTGSTLIKLRKRDSVLNFETKKDDVDFMFLKKDKFSLKSQKFGFTKVFATIS